MKNKEARKRSQSATSRRSATSASGRGRRRGMKRGAKNPDLTRSAFAVIELLFYGCEESS